MELNLQTAELALKEASESNPGAWADHSRFVAEACKNIASHCKDLSSEQAYIFGLLHDIGRYAGVSSERHLIDGYRYCMERGWEISCTDMYIPRIYDSGYCYIYRCV